MSGAELAARVFIAGIPGSDATKDEWRAWRERRPVEALVAAMRDEEVTGHG